MFLMTGYEIVNTWSGRAGCRQASTSKEGPSLGSGLVL